MKDKDIKQIKFDLGLCADLTKEELINMLNNIDFVRVEKCDLKLITGFICDYAEGEVRPLSKRIELN